MTAPTNWDDGISDWDTEGNYFDRGAKIVFVKTAPGDITTTWNVAGGYGDWTLQGTQLQGGSDLQTAVLISLFSDRTAEISDVIPDGTTDPRGWVGDLDAEYPIGSRLWLLDRSKQTQAVLNAASDYCNEALQWLIDDGIAGEIDVSTQWVRASFLGITIVIHKNDGTTVDPMNFAYVWNGI